LKNIILFLITSVNVTIQALEAVVAAIVDYFLQILNTTMKIPIISTIYKWITGEDLTFINIVTFLGAVVSTIGYKLIYGRAPFSSTATALTLGDVDVPTIFYRCAGFVRIIFTFMDFAMDLVDEADIARWFEVTTAVVPVLMNGLLFPYWTNVSDPVQDAALAVAIIPTIASIIGLVLTILKVKKAGDIVATIFGFCSEIAAIAFVIESVIHNEVNVYNIIDAFVDPLEAIPKAFKKIKPWGLVVVLVLDLVTGAVVSTVRIAFVPNTSTAKREAPLPKQIVS